MFFAGAEATARAAVTLPVSVGIVRQNTVGIRLVLRTAALWGTVATLAACSASISPMRPNARSPVVSDIPEESPKTAGLSDLDYFEEYPLMVPVVGVEPEKVPDTFKQARGGNRTHRATDILATLGTPVVAVAPGKLLRLSNNALGGITIYMLDANGRFLYYYAHLDRYADRLKAGITVRQGDLLGYVGKTGNAPVPHLHFQAMRWDPKRRDYWNGDPVDIRPYFRLSGQERTTRP